MENIAIKSVFKINNVSTLFYRYLYHTINTNHKLIVLSGARGVGKTTLLLQLAKTQQQKALYVALDDLFFSDNTLYSLADEFQKSGGKLLLLDEVHKYPNWSREIKLIYDDFNDLNVIFTSSSILEIYKGESDLSRRAITYHLKAMSFREYLLFKEDIKLPQLNLNDIVENHQEIGLDILKNFKPFEHFNNYLQIGAYPYYNDNNIDYYQQLTNSINLILDVDIQSIANLDYNAIAKIKRLLYVIATNVPFTPNISKLSTQLNINRNALVQALQLLNKAELIYTLYKQSNSISVLNKPDKIWLRNTNLSFAIATNSVNVGNIRETYFLQHLHQLHDIAIAKQGDFLIDNKLVFEIGGKNKTSKQIQAVSNAYLVKDNIEVGTNNSIPLWLFGLIY